MNPFLKTSHFQWTLNPTICTAIASRNKIIPLLRIQELGMYLAIVTDGWGNGWYVDEFRSDLNAGAVHAPIEWLRKPSTP